MTNLQSKDTKIFLRAWSSAWFLYVFNPVTGRYSRKLIRDPKHDKTPTNGFASVEPALDFFKRFRRFYAVYAYKSRLYFQAGQERWDITDADVNTKYRCKFGVSSWFRIKVNGTIVHKVRLFHPRRAIWPFIDPTYDGIDFDSDHFLYFLSEHLPRDEWKRHMLSSAPRSLGSTSPD